MNSYTGTPVNTVISDAVLAIVLGLLAFAGPQAINAIFSLSVVGLYVAYAIPIAARYLGTNDFKPGPFSLGVFVRLKKIALSGALIELTMSAYYQSLPIATISVVFMIFMSIVFMFPSEPATTAQDMNYTVVVLGGILLLSVVWYYFPKYGGVYWFTGPVRNVGIVGLEGGSANEVGSEDEKKSTLISESVEVMHTRP